MTQSKRRWFAGLALGFGLLTLLSPMALYFYTRSWNEAALSDALYLGIGLVMLISGPLIALMLWGNFAGVAAFSYLIGFFGSLDEGIAKASKAGGISVIIMLGIVPLFLIASGPIFILSATKPLVESFGADHTFCCTHIDDWAQSPDLRWLVLTERGKGAIKVTIVDLKHGQVVRWPTASGGSGFQGRALFPYQNYPAKHKSDSVTTVGAPRVEGEYIIASAIGESGGYYHSTNVRVHVPSSIAAAFSRSWRVARTFAAPTTRNSHVERSSRSRTQWTSGNGAVTMTLPHGFQGGATSVISQSPSLLDWISFGLDSSLWLRTRREVLFRDSRSNALLRIVRLAHLPTEVGYDTSSIGEHVLMVTSNYTGSWWVIATGDILRLVHVPVGASAVVGEWSCRSSFGETTAFYSSNGTGVILRPGDPNGASPLDRAAMREGFRYSVNGAALTVRFTAIQVRLLRGNAGAATALLRGGATRLRAGWLGISKSSWSTTQMRGRARIHGRHLLIRWMTKRTPGGREYPARKKTACTRA